MKKLARFGWLFAIVLLAFTFVTKPAHAQEGAVLGIDILNPAEAQAANALLKPANSPENSADDWHFVTIPLSLNDLSKKDEWQQFFDYAKVNHMIPVVRLATRFEDGAWKVPTKKDVVDLFAFLGALNWPTDERYVIAFNEVNHATEWGNHIDPAEYTQTLQFVSDWAKTEKQPNYKVLPAAMDLAAPTGRETREAFSYLEQMLATNPDIFKSIDYWNSHSYPNPAFSSSPTMTAKNSVRGFVHELAFIKKKTDLDLKTFITETGWSENSATRNRLAGYYDYMVDKVWSDPRIMAVTPFVLQGDPGPFSTFTFLNKENQPTLQYVAYQKAIKKLAAKNN